MSRASDVVDVAVVGSDKVTVLASEGSSEGGTELRLMMLSELSRGVIVIVLVSVLVIVVSVIVDVDVGSSLTPMVVNPPTASSPLYEVSTKQTVSLVGSKEAPVHVPEMVTSSLYANSSH